MITGRVNRRYEAVITITLTSLATREYHHFPAVIDTGLDHFLALPREVILRLGYPIINETRPMLLADEQPRVFEETVVGALWDGAPKAVPALVSESETLVGAWPLAGYYLTAVMVPGGRVTLTKLP